MTALVSSQAGRIMAWALALLTFGTIVGLIALWPNGSRNDKFKGGVSQQNEHAEVTKITPTPCQGPQPGTSCDRVVIKLDSGPDKGGSGDFTIGDVGAQPDLSVGDHILVLQNQAAQGAQGGQSGELLGDEELGGGGSTGAGSIDTYAFVDFERTTPMLLLAILFVIVALLVGRLRGARSLIGLGASLAIVLVFIVPAILDGRSPLAVAVVGSLAVMLVTMGLAHGIGPKSAAAALGTSIALLVTVVLALLFTDLAHLSGFTSEEATFLQLSDSSLSLTGLVVAGIVIAALGVLDDLTLTQSSAVLALRHANPTLRARALYGRALDVGRDHITATINTLVLAYVGASLPILLLFSVGDLPFGDTINQEVIAEQVVATLVGSIGLMSAVPITTALAALLAVRIPPASLADAGHSH
jgi:uncharacterized membrane protein